MKSIYFLPILFVGSLFAQNHIINWETENLKGKMRSFEQKTYIIDKDTGEETLKYVVKYTFEEDGQIDKIENFNTDGSLISYDDYLYENELLTKVINYNSASKISQKTVYQYNDKSLLINEKKYSKHDKLQYETTYIYNDENQLSEINKSIPQINYQLIEKYIYDQENNIAEIIKINRIGESKELFLYNEKKMLAEKRSFNALGELFDHTTYSYNEFSDKIGLKKFESDNSISYFETYEFFYDEKKNWVKRKNFKKNELSSIEIRQLTYY